MRKFDIYNMTGRTEEDCKAIKEMIKQEIELTVDDQDRVYNEGGIYIADMIEAPESGIEI